MNHNNGFSETPMKDPKAKPSYGWIVLFIVGIYYLSSPSANIESSSHSEINAAITSSQPTLIYFYANWCGTCKETAPTVSAFSNEIGTQAKVILVNIDQHPEVAVQFGVNAIPTFVSLRDKKERAREVGVISSQDMRQMLGL